MTREETKIASRLRFRRWYGIERTDPQLIVGAMPAKQSRAAQAAQAIRHWLHYFATHRIECYASEMSGHGRDAALRLIERHKITSVMGYPTGIADLADYAKEQGWSNSRLKAIFTNSETLFPEMKQRIHSGFGIQPRSDYVATEGAIAHECPAGGLHINMEETLVELLPPENSDGSGRMVVTFLHTHDFPLIRYAIGDVARWTTSPCPCGRGLQTIDGFVGRFTDGIRLPDGRFYNAAIVSMRISYLPEIHRLGQYQLAQITGDVVELRLLQVAKAAPQVVDTLVEELRALFCGMRVQVSYLSELPREQSGKFRAVVGLKESRSERH